MKKTKQSQSKKMTIKQTLIRKPKNKKDLKLLIYSQYTLT